ncbi:hypothetical protein [Streptomyces tsukubensis]|nr:hypothetical protein [Streptomyces tsukubensis]ADU56366.1 hypothetical protein Tcs_55098_013 [Streptomyces tacrolimicus]QFR96918.1 hypothetical protein GBW32_32580 [Streptomyces tsukubensis]
MGLTMPDFLHTLRDWSMSGLRLQSMIRTAERVPAVPDTLRYSFGLVDRPMYAYGARKAVELAASAGYSGVTLLEFGVGSGGGLQALSRHARHYSRSSGLNVHVVGFDSGSGLPESTDYRDLLYVWNKGQYPMDSADLRDQLRGSAELVLGDVAETVPGFLRTHSEHLARNPLGFISFDLDYYSSTASAFEIFRSARDEQLLPRITSYFDDIITILDRTGELAAIADFNGEDKHGYIGRVNALRSHLPFDPAWADQIFEYHRFDHRDYNRHESARDSPTWRP